jgi:hypothetical protein
MNNRKKMQEAMAPMHHHQPHQKKMKVKVRW